MDYVTNMNKCPLNNFKFLSLSKSEHKHITSVIEDVVWGIMRLMGMMESIQSKFDSDLIGYFSNLNNCNYCLVSC